MGRALAGGGGATVHGPAPPATAWSKLVCFAGLGPGEVTVAGAKVVGMGQRRTRAGALFQCAALLEWAPVRCSTCWPSTPASAGLLRPFDGVAAGRAWTPDRLATAFEGALTDA